VICFFLSCIGGLHASIEAYIAANLTSRVSLLATTHREGLIRARMFGARKATGQVSQNVDGEISKWLIL
jgi:polypeptide N-acetylgalactosaminyltransferase